MKNRFLLIAISCLSLLMSHDSFAQYPIVIQNFDLTPFPPTGWKDSTVTHTGTGYYKWWQSPGSVTSITVPASGSFPVSTPSPVSGHNGSAGMAWYNSSHNAAGDSATLATPRTLFPLSAGGASTRLSFWLYSDNTNSPESVTVWFNDSPCACNSQTGFQKINLGTFQPNNQMASPPRWTNHIIGLDNLIQGGNPVVYPEHYYIVFESSSNGVANDLYLDDIEIDSIPNCNGKPNVGHVIAPARVCSSFNFTLYLSDTSVANGIHYQWQVSSPDSLSFTNILNDTFAIATTSQTAGSYYRCYAVCDSSAIADTSYAFFVGTNPFYLCYCQTGPGGVLNANISSVAIYTTDTFARALIPILTNGIPPTNPSSPGPSYPFHAYTNYQSVTPTVLHLDSLYLGRVYGMGSSFTTDSIWVFIDYNQDGVYSIADSELAFKGKPTGTSVQYAHDTFRIPPYAVPGLTGMRVFQYSGTVGPPFGTCGPSNNGEVEDYLVNISLDNCAGFPNAGTSLGQDSALCPPVLTKLTNNTHEQHETGLFWYWQESIDGGVRWSPAPLPGNTDVVFPLYTSAALYRLAIGCNLSHDTSFSNNVVLVSNPPAFCDSCFSYANGLTKDSTDFGAFGFANYLFERQDSINNPHLNNALANRPHTDYTAYTMSLLVGAKYHLFAYQIMKHYHSNAKITLFIDYNNNHRYDPATELVWTAFTRVDTFFVSTDITMPHSGFVVPNKPLTMRLIINSNTGPSAASDSACGTYVSGETEDFIVVIHDSAHVSVGNISTIDDLVMYPNPTSGKFHVNFTTSSLVKDVSVRVTNVTGQTVLMHQYSNVNGEFNTELDLGNQPTGLYYIELIADGQRTVRMETVN